MGNYTKVKNIMLYVLNNAEYLSFMNHVLDLANGNSGGGDSESPDEISLLTGSDGIPELGLTKEFLDTYEADLLAMPTWWTRAVPRRRPSKWPCTIPTATTSPSISSPASHGPVPSRWRPSVTRASTYTRSSSPITASPAFPWRRRPPR